MYVNPITEMPGSLFYSHRSTETPKDSESGVATQNIYFLDRGGTGLKGAAIRDPVLLRSNLSLPVPVYFKNSDALTSNRQALCQIRHCPSRPSQLCVEPQSRGRVSTEVSC